MIETERLTLRPLDVEADLDELVVLNNDPEVMRFLDSGPRPATREEVRVYYRNRVSAGGYRAASEKESGRFIGWFSFHQEGLDPGDHSLGYRLQRWAWGRGYATEGCRALIDHGFTVLGLSRVSAETMAVNARSRRVMEKAGLTYVRTFHLTWDVPLPGTEQGEVEYAITREEWERRLSTARSAGR